MNKPETMNSSYRILFLSLLTFSLPIEKESEIFVWRNWINKIESVFHINRSQTKGRLCLYKKSLKEIEKKNSACLNRKYNYLIREKLYTIKITHSVFVQEKWIERFKNRLIIAIILNIIFVDET